MASKENGKDQTNVNEPVLSPFISMLFQVNALAATTAPAGRICLNRMTMRPWEISVLCTTTVHKVARPPSSVRSATTPTTRVCGSASCVPPASSATLPKLRGYALEVIKTFDHFSPVKNSPKGCPANVTWCKILNYTTSLNSVFLICFQDFIARRVPFLFPSVSPTRVRRGRTGRWTG